MGYQPLVIQLPPELLEEICHINADCDLVKRVKCCRRDHRTYKDILPPPLRDTMSASQVCKAWRDVLNRSPSIWQHFINPCHPHAEWRQLMLERSKPLGITYSLLPPDWIDAKKFEMEMCFADLLTSYSVALNMDCDVWKRPEHLVPKRWPKLEYLCIAHLIYEPTAIEHQGYLRAQRRLGNMQMPDNFPSVESTPLLKRLHLHSCLLERPLQLLGLTNLTELRVSRALDVTQDSIWSSSRWLQVIVGLPHLRRLSLIHSIARYERSRADHGDNVYPLNLEEFCLKDCERTVSYFLWHLDIKVTRIFHLLVYTSTNSTASVEAMKYIQIRISPIVQHTLTVNPLFLQNSFLSISRTSVECCGFRKALPGGIVPRLPRDHQPEGTFFEGVHVEIELDPPTFVDLPIEEFRSIFQSRQVIHVFRPIFDRVTILDLHCCADQLIYDSRDTLSEILWRSSHCLRSLQGVDLQIWAAVYQNISPSSDLESILKTQNIHGPFLRALVSLEFSINGPLPPDHPLVLQLLEFCGFKYESGAPLLALAGLVVLEEHENHDGITSEHLEPDLDDMETMHQ